MQKLGIALTLATLAPVALLHAQPAPAPPPQPAPPSAPLAGQMRPLLDPSESFGATYGTRNLARQPDAVVPLHNPAAQHTLKLSPSDLLAAQNARRQPPAALGAFTTYLHTDPLLQQMMQTGGADAAALVVLAWNHVALDMTSIDHTTAGTPGVFEPTYGEQFGPPRSARAMAMVHLAMFEAANAIDPRFKSYTPPGSNTTLGATTLASLPTGTPHPTPKNASLAAAISQAAYDTLVSLYPKKQALLDASKLTIGIAVTAQEPTEPGDATARIALGEQVGAGAAAAVIAARENDGSNFNARQQPCAPASAVPVPICWEGYFHTPIPVPANPADWTADEIVPNPVMLGVNWNKVTPFVLTPHQFITDAGLQLPGGLRPVPVAANLQANLPENGYGAMIPDPHGGPGHIYSKYGVHNFGGFGATPGFPIAFPPGQGKRALTTTARTADQTMWGEFWGYDATALLCAPPRLYNMVATSFLMQHMPKSDGHQPVETARYLALVNLALADAGVAAWDAKYKYHIARPITFIRNYEGGSEDDSLWTPLGQVASNGAVTNVTPPFPAWPSGHAVFGGALFTMLAKTTGVDKAASPFDFVSDEFNGNTIGGDGRTRPLVTAHYISLAAAEWENAESRIWLGIHWQSDADDGSALGDAIGDAVFTHALQPLTP